jgi:glucose-1-phosphate adenylyltransferase
MGIYVFDFDAFAAELLLDAGVESSTHDFGKDVLPKLVREGRADAFKFTDRVTQQPGYWRDVGTIDAYWQAHMELLADKPQLNLADTEWPIMTRPLQLPPTRMLQSHAGSAASIANSIISPGCVIYDAIIRNSVLSPGVQVMPGAVVEDSVLLPNVTVGKGCHVQRAFVDADVCIADNSSVRPELVEGSCATNGVCLLCNAPQPLPTLIETRKEEVAA